MTLNITTIGDQACVVLSPQELNELGVQPGDRVSLQRASETAEPTESDRQLEIAKQVMFDRREVLRRLAE